LILAKKNPAFSYPTPGTAEGWAGRRALWSALTRWQSVENWAYLEISVMSAWKRWQDWTTVVLGILLFIAPFGFNVPLTGAAAWTAYTGGVLLAIVGLYDLYRPADQTGEWTEVVLGVLVFIAPWVLGFAALVTMAWSAWVIGVLAVALACWVIFGGTRKATLSPQG
jgi:uncharacterized membrane protein